MRLFFVLFSILCLSSCGSGEYIPTINPPDGIREGDDGSSYQLLPYSTDGNIQFANVLDGESRVLEEGLMHLGLKEGAWITYDHRFGRDMVQSVYNYRDGVKHGPYSVLEGGQMQERGSYYAGLQDGKITKFDRGILTDEIFYKNGQMNGIVTRYYQDGTVKEAGNFVNGLRDGLHKWFNQAGEVIIEYQYKEGERLE
ncbi:MAG: hypothetical protein AAF502_22070 [Bacteroidota bacterium]